MQKILFLGKIYLLKHVFCTFIFVLLLTGVWAQEEPAETTQINIVYGANFTKDEAKYPGASIFSKDDKQVQFEHQGQIFGAISPSTTKKKTSYGPLVTYA